MTEIIISIITAIGGWELIRYLINLRTNQRKENAEADSAENNATKELQDVYQQLINDVKTDRDEQREYINELKESRRHLREECEELRQRIENTEKTVRRLQREVDLNGRMVESLRPFICGNLACRKRQPATISVSEENETPQTPPPTRKKTKATTDIEPLDMKDM